MIKSERLKALEGIIKDKFGVLASDLPTRACAEAIDKSYSVDINEAERIYNITGEETKDVWIDAQLLWDNLANSPDILKCEVIDE